MSVSDKEKPRDGVLKPLGLSTSVALTYIIIYIPLMLVTDKHITMDNVALPAIGIYLVTFIIEYLFSRNKKSAPQWLTLFFFMMSVIVAVFMFMIV